MADFLVRVQRNPESLSLLSDIVASHLSWGAALNLGRAELFPIMRLEAQVLTALFLVAASGGKKVRVQIGDASVEYEGKAIQVSAASHSRWVRAFFLSAACRDRGLLEALCHIPADISKTPTSKSPEFYPLWVETLQMFIRGDNNTSKKLIAALKATDPKRPDISDAEYVLNIVVPQMHLFYNLISEDTDKFRERLNIAVQDHKNYWTKSEKRSKNPDGFLACNIIGLCAIAVDKGFDLKFDSEYVASELFLDKSKS